MLNIKLTDIIPGRRKKRLLEQKRIEEERNRKIQEETELNRKLISCIEYSLNALRELRISVEECTSRLPSTYELTFPTFE